MEELSELSLAESETSIDRVELSELSAQLELSELSVAVAVFVAVELLELSDQLELSELSVKVAVRVELSELSGVFVHVLLLVLSVAVFVELLL